MNDTLFPAPFDADRDRREGLRNGRGIVIGIGISAVFEAGVVVGALMHAGFFG